MTPAVKYRGFEELWDAWPTCLDMLDRDGALLLEGPDSSIEVLKKLCSLLGVVQNHPPSPDGSGIVNVVSSASEGARFEDVAGSMSFVPHVDGHYLDGIVWPNGEPYRIGPPMLIVLQCVTQADAGGETLLVDSAKVLECIAEERPELLSGLFSPYAQVIRRGAHVVPTAAVVSQRANGRYAVRFSADSDALAESWARPALAHFSRLAASTGFQQRFTLKSGQLLLVDNHRVMHGRSTITGRRLLRRVWIEDDHVNRRLGRLAHSTTFENFERNRVDRIKDDTPYDAYMGIPSTQPSRALKPVTTGAVLSPKTREIVFEWLHGGPTERYGQSLTNRRHQDQQPAPQSARYFNSKPKHLMSQPQSLLAFDMDLPTDDAGWAKALALVRNICDRIGGGGEFSDAEELKRVVRDFRRFLNLDAVKAPGGTSQDLTYSDTTRFMNLVQELIEATKKLPLVVRSGTSLTKDVERLSEFLRVRPLEVDAPAVFGFTARVASQTKNLDLDSQRPGGRKGKKALIIYVSPKTSGELKDLAHQCRTSVQFLVSDLIEDFVAKYDTDEKAERLAEEVARKMGKASTHKISASRSLNS